MKNHPFGVGWNHQFHVDCPFHQSVQSPMVPAPWIHVPPNFRANAAQRQPARQWGVTGASRWAVRHAVWRDRWTFWTLRIDNLEDI